MIALIGVLFAPFATHRLSLWREQRARQVGAAATFRAAIDPGFIGDLRGHALVLALVGAQHGTGPRIDGIYAKHRRAVNEFRHYLGPIDRFRLNRVWEAYHGGNEDCPDFLVLYGITQDGPERLKKHIETLRNVVSHA